MADHKETSEEYLQPTAIIDCDHPDIRNFAQKATDGAEDTVDRARRLFYAVRDPVVYDAKSAFYLPEHYVSSNVLRNGRGYCVQKACLLCSAGRAVGIPSRLGFADIRNHGASQEMVDLMGCNIFAYHGYVEFYLEGNWVKATPAFDVQVFQKHNIAPVEFDGRNHSVFPSHDLSGKPYVEYLVYHGTSADLPLDALLESWRTTYGDDRVKFWMDAFEAYFKGLGEAP